ncbi:uncharacterized protein METZ01_LOCUS210902 [marine metagenome]|uniref:Uncharacterized protein n=1 Tax=marine metagenome TaxID=408172 RepID=A0A382F4U6_9ZZZZ
MEVWGIIRGAGLTQITLSMNGYWNKKVGWKNFHILPSSDVFCL